MQTNKFTGIPPPSKLRAKSVEGLEFGLKHKYFFPSENDELKPK